MCICCVFGSFVQILNIFLILFIDHHSNVPSYGPKAPNNLVFCLIFNLIILVVNFIYREDVCQIHFSPHQKQTIKQSNQTNTKDLPFIHHNKVYCLWSVLCQGRSQLSILPCLSLSLS